MLVQPHLEYCSPMWSPYYTKDEDLIELVQNRMTRMITGYKDLNYKELLQHLSLWSLEEHRNRVDLIEL